MTRFTPIGNSKVRDTVTGKELDVITSTVQYAHYRKNVIETTLDGHAVLFSPTVYPPGLTDMAPGERDLIVEYRNYPESDERYPVVVAVQSEKGADDYMECTVNL